MVVSCLPGPQEAQADRLPRLLPKRLVRARAPAELLEEIARIERAVEGCEAGPDTPCMVFVSKVRAGAEDTVFKFSLSFFHVFLDTQKASGYVIVRQPEFGLRFRVQPLSRMVRSVGRG
jgi:hypothetical protein